MTQREVGLQSTKQPIGVLIAEALSLPEKERSVFLNDMCGNDAELHGQLVKMIGDAETAVPEMERSSLEIGIGIIGDYKVLDEIARGGMGVIYRANQISLDRPVALKLIRETSLASLEERARFRIEAEAAAGIDHPHLVPIYEIGEEDGQLFYSMKLIEGGTLAALPEAWKTDRKLAMGAMAKVARALQAVHEAGVLHRDLKPGNILLDEDGQPFLTDFGLARRINRETMLTLTGQVIGTPNYMSPEQARGGKLTTVSDVYGFGAVLYQVLTGEPPFAGESTVETLRLVAEEPPKSPNLGDRDLETIVMKCLEKSAADRYGSAAAVAEDLERWANAEPISARPATPTERARKWVRRNPTLAGFWSIAAVLIMTLAIGGPLWALNQGRLNQEIAAESERRLDELYIAEMNQASDAYRESSGLEELRYLSSKWAGPEHADRRGWEWRFLSNAAKADEGRVLLKSREFAFDSKIDWSPNGKWILAPDPEARQVCLFDADSGELVHRLGSANAEPDSLVHARFSPDGSKAVVVWRANRENPNSVISIPEGEILGDFRPYSGIIATDWSLQGQQLLLGGRGLRSLDAATGEILAEDKNTLRIENLAADPAPGSNRVATATRHGEIFIWNVGKYAERTHFNRGQTLNVANEIRMVDWSPDGKLLAVSGAEKSVDLWNVDEQIVYRQLPVRHPKSEFAFCPNSKAIAVFGQNEDTILVYSVRTGELMYRLRGHDAPVVDVAWSPEGTKLVSSSMDNTVRRWELPRLGEDNQQFLCCLEPRFAGPGFAMIGLGGIFFGDAADLKTPARRLSVSQGVAGLDGYFAVSPNDEFLAFGYHYNKPNPPDFRGLRIYTISDGLLLVEGDEAPPTASVSEGYRPYHRARLRWSPDSKMLAVRRIGNGQPVKIFDLDLKKIAETEPSAEYSGGICWSLNSRHIFTRSGDEIARFSLEDKSTFRLKCSPRDCRDISMDPKGRWIACCSGDQIELVNPESLEAVATLSGHKTITTVVAWSPDGSRLASFGKSEKIRIWDPVTKRQVALLHAASGGRVDSIAWTEDGRFLLATDRYGQLHRFDGREQVEDDISGRELAD